jgi:hypothetical protein
MGQRRNDPLEELRALTIHWLRASGEAEWTTTYQGEEASLRMNDFPEEPLYTLSYRGYSVDFNETPKGWTREKGK